MSTIRKVLIAGAGPAGSSLAIRLARLGVEVTLIDRDRFPRQKLCGEFISPECFRLLDELGACDTIESLGGSPILQTCFYSASGSVATVPTRWFGGRPALGLSRAAFDNALLERARQSGVRVLCETRLVDIKAAGSTISAAIIKSSDGTRSELDADLFVDATGRQAAFAALLGAQRGLPVACVRPKYVAFKNHFLNASPEPQSCEMYFFPGGYGGLNRIERDLFNFCFIVRLGSHATRRPEQLLQQVIIAQNPKARQTMRAAVALREWIGVPVSAYGFADRISADNLLYVGDSGAFIDPFTGSGILMALEGGSRAANCLEASDLNARRALRFYALQSRSQFGTRLLSASILRRAAFSGILSSSAIFALGRFSSLRRLLALSTRREPNGHLR